MVLSVSKNSGRETTTYGYNDKSIHIDRNSCDYHMYYNASGYLVGVDSINDGQLLAWDGNSIALINDSLYVNEESISGGSVALSDCRDIVVSDYLGNSLCVGSNVLMSTVYGESDQTQIMTGKPYLSGIGLYVFRHRHYSPNIARWTTPDPSGYPDGTNSFVYFHDPNVGSDPYGTSVSLWVKGKERQKSFATRWGVETDPPKLNPLGAIMWNYQKSTAAYYRNRIDVDSSSITFRIDCLGYSIFGVERDRINLALKVYQDAETGFLHSGKEGLPKVDERVLGAGAHINVERIPNRSECTSMEVSVDANVSYKGTGIEGVGVNSTGASVTFNTFKYEKPYKLGTWIYKSKFNEY